MADFSIASQIQPMKLPDPIQQYAQFNQLALHQAQLAEYQRGQGEQNQLRQLLGSGINRDSQEARAAAYRISPRVGEQFDAQQNANIKATLEQQEMRGRIGQIPFQNQKTLGEIRAQGDVSAAAKQTAAVANVDMLSRRLNAINALPPELRDAEYAKFRQEAVGLVPGWASHLGPTYNEDTAREQAMTAAQSVAAHAAAEAAKAKRLDPYTDPTTGERRVDVYNPAGVFMGSRSGAPPVAPGGASVVAPGVAPAPSPGPITQQANMIAGQAAPANMMAAPAPPQFAAPAAMPVAQAPVAAPSATANMIPVARAVYEKNTAEAMAAQETAKANRKEGAQQLLHTAGGENAAKIEALINASTSGLIENAGASVKGMLPASVGGGVTPGKKNIAQLDHIAKQMTFELLNGKLSAGISNEDRKFIQGLVADIGNPNTPAEERLAGFRQLKNTLDAWATGKDVEIGAPAGVAKTAEKPTVNGRAATFTEGQTATGPNGAKIIFRNGQWTPQ